MGFLRPPYSRTSHRILTDALRLRPTWTQYRDRPWAAAIDTLGTLVLLQNGRPVLLEIAFL